MRSILEGNQILAMIFKNEDWKEGLHFLTPQNLFIQAGTWYYPKGKKLASHLHKDYERTALRTQELVYVRKGSLKVFVYNDRKELKEEFILSEGEMAVMAYGGHGYEILEEGTQVLEVKNGPFISVEHDKNKFES